MLARAIETSCERLDNVLDALRHAQRLAEAAGAAAAEAKRALKGGGRAASEGRRGACDGPGRRRGPRRPGAVAGRGVPGLTCAVADAAASAIFFILLWQMISVGGAYDAPCIPSRDAPSSPSHASAPLAGRGVIGCRRRPRLSIKYKMKDCAEGPLN